jgi:uncharacterized membrane protein YphA (DoxX/SURF4 family)
VPSDEELRKVAEDVRALARSLARDLLDASRSAHSRGHPAREAVRHGLRDARRDLQRGMGRHRYWSGYGPQYPGQNVPPAPGPPGPEPTGHSQPGPAGPPGWGRRPQSRYQAAPAWARYGPPGYAPRPPRPPRQPSLPPVRRRWDASILAGLLIVVFGSAWLISGLGVVHVSTEAVLAAGLMLLGAALIVTARTDWSLSRHAWPVVVGVLLVAGLFATSSSFGVSGALSHLSIGNQTVRARADQTIYGGVGQLNVDVSGVAPGSTVHVESLVGETFVDPAPGQSVVVQGRVLAGQVCLPPNAPSVAATGAPVTVIVHQLAGEIGVAGQGCHHR